MTSIKIGIVGAGHIGQAIAKLAVAKGHEVMISNSREPETLASTAAALGCAVGTAEEAEEFGELVVVTVPLKNIASIPSAPVKGKIVIDTNNYYPERDGHIAELDERRTTTSELVAEHFADARIVKAFNAILAVDLDPENRQPLTFGRRALPLASDDDEAKQVVARLYDQFGFDAFDAGSLENIWRFERAKPAYCIPLDRASLERALAQAERNVELPDGSWRR